MPRNGILQLATRGLAYVQLASKPLILLFEFMQPVVLFILLLCFSYLYSREKMTQGWGDSRRFGMLENGLCDGSKTYAVRDVNILNPNTDDDKSRNAKLFAPLVFVTKGGGGGTGHQLCFSPTGLLNLLAFLQTYSFDISVETLGDAFQLQTTGSFTIIYYSTWVVAVSAICLFFQAVFFSDLFDTVTPDRGRFMTSENMLTLTRVHTGLLVLLVALLVSSSSNFSLLKTIQNCSSTYIGKDDFCSLLQSTSDLRVAFVLFPSEGIVQNYRSISLFLAILVVVSCFAKPRRNRYAPQHHRIAAAPPESDQALDRIVLALNQRLGVVNGSQLVRSGNTLVIVPRQGSGAVAGALSQQDFLASQQRVWTRNAMISSWKRLRADAVQADRSCSICLDPLTTCPDGSSYSSSHPSVAADVESQQFIAELPCGHRFHHVCIREWCVLQSTCPECRKALT